MNYFEISSLQGVFQIPKDSSGLMKRLDVFPEASCASPVPHQGLTKTKKREALEHFAHFEIRMQRKENSSRCTSCVDSLDQVIRRRWHCELFQFEEQLAIERSTLIDLAGFWHTPSPCRHPLVCSVGRHRRVFIFTIEIMKEL